MAKKQTLTTGGATPINGNASKEAVKLITANATPKKEEPTPEKEETKSNPVLSAAELLSMEINRTEEKAELVTQRRKIISDIERLTAKQKEFKKLNTDDFGDNRIRLSFIQGYNDEVLKLSNPQVIYLFIDFAIDRLQISLEKIEEKFLKL